MVCFVCRLPGRPGGPGGPGGPRRPTTAVTTEDPPSQIVMSQEQTHKKMTKKNKRKCCLAMF